MSTALPSGAWPNGVLVTLGAVLVEVLGALLVEPLAAALAPEVDAALSALAFGEQLIRTTEACAAIATVQRRTFIIVVSARVGVGQASHVVCRAPHVVARDETREDVVAAGRARGARPHQMQLRGDRLLEQQR
jgi:hypothetical protein